MNQFWQCGRYRLPLGRKTYIMGIVNTTPDSFSGDGRLDGEAINYALQLVAEGADILDIGGESTRPGAQKISADEELLRVLPVIETLASRLDVPLSVDTTKAEVAVAVIQAGASIINDISGGTFDEKMFSAIAPANCGYVLMHLRGTPQTMGWSTRVRNEECGVRSDVIAEIIEFWNAQIDAAKQYGIEAERLCLDAGFGFGKSAEENLEILRRGNELTAPGFPTLSATSRKSTISKVLSTTSDNDLPPGERVWGTAAATALAIAQGADIVRVHDVREMSQVARVTDAVVRDVAHGVTSARLLPHENA